MKNVKINNRYVEAQENAAFLSRFGNFVSATATFAIFCRFLPFLPGFFCYFSAFFRVNLLKNEEKSRGAISGTGPPLTKKNFRKFPKMSGNFPEISRKFFRKYPRPSSVILSATFSTSANLGGFSGKIFGNFDKNLKIPGFLIIFGRFFDPF